MAAEQQADVGQELHAAAPEARGPARLWPAPGPGRRPAAGGPPSRRDRPVWRRNTSSRLGSDRPERPDRQAGLVEQPEQAGQGGRAVAGVQPDRVARHAEVADGGLPGQLGGGLPGRVRVAGDEDDRVPRHLLLQRARGAFGDHRAVIDDHDAVAEHVGLVQVVRGQEHRGAPVPEGRGCGPQAGPVLRVEAGARLVQEQDLGLVHDAERDVEPPPLAAGVRPHPAVGEPGQVEQVEHLPHPAGDAAAAAPVQPALQDQVLPAGGQLVGPAQLAHIADAAADLARLAPDVQPGDRGAAAVDRQQRGQHPQRGGLACPVRAEESDDLAPGDLQADPAHRLDRPARPPGTLAQLPGVDDRGHDAPSWPARLGRRPGQLSNVYQNLSTKWMTIYVRRPADTVGA